MNRNVQQWSHCPKCNTVVSVGAKFCGNCGIPLIWPTQQQEKLTAQCQESQDLLQMNWFQKHLNWTSVLSYLLWFIGNAGESVIARILTFIAAIFWLVVSGWVIKQKGRSLWWILLSWIGSPLWLKNRSYPSQSTGLLSREITMSQDLYKFCWDSIHMLAVSFNDNLLKGIEYEACFERVMARLVVLHEEKEEIFSNIIEITDLNPDGIPYHKLSPVNQFMVTIPGYVFYRLRNTKFNNEALFNEATSLMQHPGFAQYLQKEIGAPITKKVKGALWKIW